MNKNVYVLYDSTDDSVVCSLSDPNTMLFKDKKSALDEWVGYPEEVTHFSRLPKHIKEMIMEEQTAKRKLGL